MSNANPIIPCLWFNGVAEEAAAFYVASFKNSKITGVTRFGGVGEDVTGGKPGSVMTVEFELDGQPFTALNGGPLFKFTEAISLQVLCDTQAELDQLWNRLSAGGDPKAQQCGWLKDKFGVSWQVTPRIVQRLLADRDRARADRAMKAMLAMKKFDIAELERAAKG